MNITTREKKRAANIIWSAAGDYSVQSSFQAFDDQGRAELYWNMVIGLAHQEFEFFKLDDFFQRLEEEPEGELFINLTWLGLESAIVGKATPHRTALMPLRLEYARTTLAYAEPPGAADLYGQLYLARLREILGLPAGLPPAELTLLHQLTLSPQLDADGVIREMDRIIHDTFRVKRAHQHLKRITRNFNRTKLFHFGERSVQTKGVPYIKRVSIGSAQQIQGPGGLNEDAPNKSALHWFSFREQSRQRDYEEIQESFGLPILETAETAALETIVCQGDHQACHLHFTRGEYPPGEDFHRIQAIRQRDRNLNYRDEHQGRIHNSIHRLAHKLQNTILVNFQPNPVKATAGKLLAGKVWRSTQLNDPKVFERSSYDELGGLCIDLLLDASASQLDRQEIIAAQGFIIAEALTRCQIPVKVYSFCNRYNYTVINLFRDYPETDRNLEIFNYFAAGFNRDGLAIRTAVHLLSSAPYDNRILIVLSDGKPHDLTKVGTSLLQHAYAKDIAVNDAAREVRQGRGRGISILCVFTGRDEDLPAAQTIYGRPLAHIQSPERFADTVGILIQNELLNM